MYVTDSICQLTDTAQIIVTVVDSVLAEVIDPISVCNNDPIDISVNSYGTANTFIWSENSNFSNPLNAPTDSVITVTTSEFITYKWIMAFVPLKIRSMCYLRHP